MGKIDNDIDERTTPLFLSSPERIGLAIGDEMDDWNYQFDDCDEGQITWYTGSNEPLTVCIEYVRSDIVEKLRADLAAAQEELRALRAIDAAAAMAMRDSLMEVCRQRDEAREELRKAREQEPVAWDGAEGWESLAFELCEDECDDPHAIVYEGYPLEPWGERWQKYEYEAKRMIRLVRKHTAILSATDTEVK